jgi:hypothetical protein
MNAGASAGKYGVVGPFSSGKALSGGGPGRSLRQMTDAIHATKGILTDAESRWKLVEALASALNDASRKLARNADGDFSPDPAAQRFAWKETVLASDEPR